MANPKIIFSIVVGTYNGERRIAETLKSLMKLDYPQAKYEIIIVNDGSTDKVASVVRRFKKAKLVSHTINQGISVARNTGLAHATGKYVAYLDDDCTADKQWLKELEKTVSQPDTLAAGGYIAPKSTKHVVQRYLSRSGYGSPAKLAEGRATSPVARFWAYLQNMYTQATEHSQPESVVSEVYGANSVFYRSKLKKIGGFPADLRSSEDTAICNRLQRHYPNLAIRFNPNAKVNHNFTNSFLRYILTLFHRQRDTLKYYKLLNKTVPLYPFPFLIFITVISVFLYVGWPALILFVILPPVIYGWWTVQAIKMHSLEPILFAYMQLIEESVRLLGLAVAYIRTSLMKTTLFLVLTSIIVLHLFGIFYNEIPMALLIILLPGYLVATIYKIGKNRLFEIPEFVALVMALGILWLMFVGVIATVLLPVFGIARPLSVIPITLMYVGSVAILFTIKLLQASVKQKIMKQIPMSINVWAILCLCGLILLTSVIGAIQLNNGGTSAVAIISLLLSTFTLVVSLLKSKILPSSILSIVLFSVSLGALWSYSLRSSYLFGWDIQQEYATLQNTLTTGNWHLGAVHQAYDAMLSLTVLPTVLANISGSSGLTLFKVLFPIIFSFVPVFLYYAYRNFTKKWIAFVAAALLIAQFAYMQEFSALIRQQVSFLFFSGLIYVIFSFNKGSYKKNLLVSAFIIGMIISHYSTTYLTIALLTSTYVFTKCIYFIRRKERTLIDKSYVNGWMILILLLGTIVWYGPATHSSGLIASLEQDHNYSSLAQNAWERFGHVSVNQNSTLPDNNQITQSYLNTIGAKYNTKHPYLGYYVGQTNAEIHAVPPQVIKAVWTPAQSAMNWIDTILRYTWWIIGALGIAITAWKLLSYFDLRKLEIVIIEITAIGVFVVGHSVNAVGQYYNIARLNEQLLMLVSLPAIMMAVWLLSRLSIIRRKIIIGSALALSFTIAAGLTTQFIGGSPTANLNNYGNDYQRFFISPAEVASTQWLETQYKSHDVIFADRYANLRLMSNTNIRTGVFNDLTPMTIAKGAYVYADTTNIVDQTTLAGYKGQVVSFQFPSTFLNTNKAVVYSNGTTKIYR